MNCANHPEMTASAFCRTCGKALCPTCVRDVRGVIYCEECLAARLTDTVPPRPAAGFVAPVAGAVPVPMVRRGSNPGLAATLSIVPGVGQMYNEQYAKGLVFVLVFAALIQLTVSFSGLIGILIGGFYFFQVIDAYNTARARQLGQPLPDPFGLNELLGGKNQLSASAAVSGEQPYQPMAAPPGAAPGAVPPPQYIPPQYGAPMPPVEETRPPSPVGAVVLIGLGVLFMLNTLGGLEFDWVHRLWPVILIAVGVWIFIRRRNAVPR